VALSADEFLTDPEKVKAIQDQFNKKKEGISNSLSRDSHPKEILGSPGDLWFRDVLPPMWASPSAPDHSAPSVVPSS